MTVDLRTMRGDPFGQLVELEGRLRAARMDVAAGEAQTWTGLGFRLGDAWFVTPREDVREVIPPPPTTRVPNARAWMRGMANVRGELLAIVDLPSLLGVGESEHHRLQRVLVLNSKTTPSGMLVDEVVGYRQFTPNEQRSEIAAESQSLSPYLLGAFVHEGQPWMVMSLHRIARGEAFRSAAL